MNEDAIIKTARERMSEAVDADRENRGRALNDLEFIVGDHWPDSVRKEREAEGKPVLTINRLPQFVRQVTGDIRRMNPAINIIPANDQANPDTAKVIEGLIRQIEYRSDASSVYERAAESAAACSMGVFRVRHDYENDASFDQEILIEPIRNPLSVYFDPAAEEPTRADAQFVFITEQMDVDAFHEAYPDANPVDIDADGATDGLEHWHHHGSVIVAEYYWKEPVTREIAMLRDGTVVQEWTPPMDVIKTRTVETHKLMWAKISGHEVLERPIEQACSHIPVIAVTGEEWHVGEEVYRSSVIRHAKDPALMYDYHSSALAEFVALQPKAPYMVSVDQVAGLEAFWNEANIKNRPYLPYNPDPKAANPPQRSTPPVSSSGLMEQIMKADGDMKATTGIYDAGLGNRSNEQSGVAIRQRQMESDVATSIYSDNMSKAIAQCGRVILELIPKIYDTQRALRILGKDDTQKIVAVNRPVLSQDGPMIENDLATGKYDVRVTVGPNYSTMRQETAEGMLNFVSAFPQAGAVTADLIAKSQDWPDADQFAERLKAILPPEIQAAQEGEQMDPGQMVMQMQQMGQRIQEMEQLLQSPQHAQAMAEVTKAQAEGVEAQADAEKAHLEVQEQRLELAAKSGQLDAVISDLVQAEVARVLSGTYRP